MISQVKNISHWILAGIIATVIALVSLAFIQDKVGGHEKVPCTQKPCYQLLDKRIQVIELAMQCPNNNCDRFKGKDAKVMEARIGKETDAKIEALRKELKK